MLEHETPFEFDKECLKEFENLREALSITSIMIEPDWNKPIELMCDASDFAIEAILGNKKDIIVQPIYKCKQDISRSTTQLHNY